MGHKAAEDSKCVNPVGKLSGQVLFAVSLVSMQILQLAKRCES